MLGHSTITISADTYASVLPEVARSAAEAAARLVPRGGQLAEPQLSGPISAPSDTENDSGSPPENTKARSGVVGPVGLEPTTYGLKSERGLVGR